MVRISVWNFIGLGKRPGPISLSEANKIRYWLAQPPLFVISFSKISYILAHKKLLYGKQIGQLCGVDVISDISIAFKTK